MSARLPKCSAKCTAHQLLYEQIADDLAPFCERGITREMIEKGLAKWAESAIFATVLILNGTVYLNRPYAADGTFATHGDMTLQQTLREIVSLTTAKGFERLPDMELLLNADDYGRTHLSDRPLLPLFSITKVRGVGADILYPTGHYNTAGGSFVRGIGHPETQQRYTYPWLEKQGRAFFRGNPNSHSRSRYALAHLVQSGPPAFRRYLDFGLVRHHAPTPLCAPSPEQP